MSDLAEKNLRIHSGFAITPEGWTETTVSQICDLGRGRVISQDEINSKPGPFPVFSSQTRNNGEMGRIDTFDFSGEYVTWTTDGENAGTVFLRSGQFNCTNVCGTLRAKAATDLDLSFLTYHLGRVAKRYVSYIGNPKLMNGVMASIGLVLPSPPQQRRIATILTTLDEVIEATEKLVEKHQQIKAGLMHDLFTRGLWTRPELARGDHKGLPSEATAQEGQLRPSLEDAPGLYQDSPLGLIPKTWQIVTTFECASESPGSTTIGPFGSDLVSADYQSEGIPVVFVRDVKATGFEWNSEVYVTPEKAFRLSAHAVRPGDILSSKMGLPPCISCTYPDWMPDGIITADMIRLRPDLSKVTSHWLSAALNSDAFKRQVQTITAGVTRPKVTLSDFRKLRLARPLLEEQKLIDALLTRHENVLSANHQHLAKLRQQKQGLMHDLLTGRVRVDGLAMPEE